MGKKGNFDQFLGEIFWTKIEVLKQCVELHAKCDDDQTAMVKLNG